MPKPTSSPYFKNRGELLVALLKSPRDLDILHSQGWYRIPVTGRRIAGFPPRHLAFYQPSSFKGEAFLIRYWGEVESVEEKLRIELLPNEPEHPRAQTPYYRVQLKSLEPLTHLIPSYRHRRLLFIPTTWEKFATAREINDLFHTSPLEDALWREVRRIGLGAERQWRMGAGGRNFLLDFAFFCKNGFINVETDGDSWHSRKEQIPVDNYRDNALGGKGWIVLRYSTVQIKDELTSYCIPNIETAIYNLGGLGYPDVFTGYTGHDESVTEIKEPRATYTVLDPGFTKNTEFYPLSPNLPGFPQPGRFVPPHQP